MGALKASGNSAQRRFCAQMLQKDIEEVVLDGSTACVSVAGGQSPVQLQCSRDVLCLTVCCSQGPVQQQPVSAVAPSMPTCVPA